LMGIGIFGPGLDSKGNSVAGNKILEDLSKELDLSIF
ncbi:MAG: glutaminase, partial [Psychrilyobacter sp.]|nr:glutaminase [Psychrilyobacter sp.]